MLLMLKYMAGTVWLMYQALSYVKERSLYSDFFDKFAFSYYSFLVVYAPVKHIYAILISSSLFYLSQDYSIVCNRQFWCVIPFFG